ncbi:hypothetical protein, partial [Shewanella algae]|uniref:hypothetical protein n=1 Tax=Shewanella algae TaxID=38313 RepID=UPI001AAD0D71
TLFKKVGKAVLNRHKKSETYKQVSDCLSSGGSVNRSLSDLRCGNRRRFYWATISSAALKREGNL